MNDWDGFYFKLFETTKNFNSNEIVLDLTYSIYIVFLEAKKNLPF